MNRAARDHVTVCVPVHNGREFVAETLDAIARQSHENFTVVISDDASDDGSPDICRTFERDSRFHLVSQTARRGWIGNCNWLLANAGSELLCIQPHDDIPEPDYLARLVACLRDAPACILAFTDVATFGLYRRVEHQDSIHGTAPQRVRTFIANHYDGTAWRGVFRRRALAVAGLMRGNGMDNFAADVAWLGRIAQAGEFRRIAEPLYRKRIRAASVAYRWSLWDEPTKAAACRMLGCELLHDAFRLRLSTEEQQLIVDAVLRRALAIEPVHPFGTIRDLPRSGKRATVEAVLAELRIAPAAAREITQQDPDTVLERLLNDLPAGASGPAQ